MQGVNHTAVSSDDVMRLMLEAQGERAVAFDIGGVLLDGGLMSSAGEDAAFLALEERFGIPRAVGAQIWCDLLDASERGEIAEAVVFETLAAAGDDCDPNLIRQTLLDMPRPVSNTVAILETLHERGWRTAAASNHLMGWAAEWRNRFSWFDLLDTVVISSDIGARKPSDEFFAELSRRMGVTGAWFVDDRLENVQGAERSGFRGIWVAPDGMWYPRNTYAISASL
jgi:HAD superfamily hydrolase (TIGR01509 family)